MRGHFTKDIQMANKHMKRCSTLLAMREMQIKTTMKYHYTPIRMIKIKNNENDTRKEKHVRWKHAIKYRL